MAPSSLTRLTVVVGCCAVAGVNAAAGWFGAGDDDSSSSNANWRPARQTVTGSLDPLGWTPRPTRAPGNHDINNNNNNNNNSSEENNRLDLRQQDDDDEGDDDDDVDNDKSNAVEFPTVCATRSAAGGFLDPKRQMITCAEGSFCTADPSVEKVGCCDDEDAAACAVPTTCLNSADLSLLKRQRADSKTLFCTDRQARFCVTYSYFGDPGGVYDGYAMFGCTSRRSRGGPVAVQQTEFFDYGGSTTATALDPTTATATTTRRETTDLTAGPTSGRGATTATTDLNPGIQTSVIISSSGDDPTVTANPLPSSSSSSSSSAAPIANQGAASDGSASSDSDSPSSSSKVGTIVGGVVGGVGGAALIATAVLFFLFRRRKKKQSQNQSSQDQDQDQDRSTMMDADDNQGGGGGMGATYYPGPHDPPLHPTQYGYGSGSGSESWPLSPPMGQASPVPLLMNSNNGDRGAAAPHRRSSRAPSSLLTAATVSPSGGGRARKTGVDEAVSPISSAPSTPSASPPPTPSVVSPGLSSPPPVVRYNRFSPPLPEQFQAYRPYPGT